MKGKTNEALRRSQRATLRQMDQAGGRMPVGRGARLDPALTEQVPPQVPPNSLIGRGLIVVVKGEGGAPWFALTEKGKRAAR